jgi:Tfp pilus assembly protein PilW
MNINRKHAGVGLVEMMVAMTAGLVVSGAAVNFLASSLRSNTEFVRSAVFTQDLRSTHEFVVRELRRAGYDENAMKYIALADGNDVTSPFAPIQVVREDAADSCVIYAYDSAAPRAGTGTGPGYLDRGAGEIRAMRRMVRTVNGQQVGVIEVAQSSTATPVIDCNGASPNYATLPSSCNAQSGWCALTDPRQLDITRFSILDNSQWNRPMSSRNGSMMRELAVTLEGKLMGQAQYQRSVTTNVRVRAECLRPLAPTDPPDVTGTLCNTAPGA